MGPLEAHEPTTAPLGELHEVDLDRPEAREHERQPVTAERFERFKPASSWWWWLT